VIGPLNVTFSGLFDRGPKHFAIIWSSEKEKYF